MNRPTLPGIVALAAALAAAAAACGSDPTLPPPGSSIIIDFDRSQEIWPRDAWDFGTAAVVDGALEIEVAFGGGCQDHDFWLVAVRGFRDIPTVGPVTTAAVPILLAHDSHGDMCEAYITELLRFDLQPLRAAFDDEYGNRVGRVVLRVPMGQGAADTLSLDYLIR